jgi:hypothetical protein
MTVNLTPSLVTRYYLFGSNTVPSNLLDESLIRSANTQSYVEVDLATYMQSGPGRFARASLWEDGGMIWNWVVE